VEVFNLQAPSLDEVDEVEDDIDPELAELDNLSSRSSACDCPAHLHDRETPLYIDKGLSQAFTVFPALAPPTQPSEEVRPTTAPPPTSLETPETGETSVREEETKTTVHFLEFPHKSYSYAVLEKKWSL